MDGGHSTHNTPTRTSGLAAHPTLSRAIQERLGRELREMYADCQREPRTDHLADLLKRLERANEPSLLRE
jgi:Anti-sigma factor NepR